MNEITFGGIEQGRMSVSTTPKALGTKGLLIAFPEGAARSIGTQWSIEIPNKNGDSYIQNLNAYNEASAALALKKTVAPSDVDVSQADVVSAQASLASAQAAFEKTVIRAPSDGTVTKIDVKLGQLAEAFSPVISIQDVGNLYIEANVNESNISHVVVGQPVSVTYDALGRDKVFMTTVSSVDLGATVVDGIVNYKVKAVVPDTTNIRSGMTANLSIQTAFVPNSVVIPERVITVSKEGVQSVEVLVDERKGRTENRTVTTGLVGDGGLVEITSGLSEGERALFSAK
jgi:RND family efflux transporter MFP subunit